MMTGNPFLAQDRAPTEDELWVIESIRAKAAELYDLINHAQPAGGSTREMALARTNLEQAVMWAVKAVTG